MNRWQEMAIRVEQMVDGLGYPVDAGIKDTVIALNLLGFRTKASCEGHVDRGTKAPWVDVTVTFDRAALAKARTAFRHAKVAEEAGRPEAEQQDLWAQAHTLKEEVERPLLLKVKALGDLLQDFYLSRSVAFGTSLILYRGATSIRLISQGALWQDVLDETMCDSCLVDYQREMQAFTDFLKAKCEP